MKNKSTFRDSISIQKQEKNMETTLSKIRLPFRKKELDFSILNCLEKSIQDSLKTNKDICMKKEKVIKQLEKFAPLQYSWEKYYFFRGENTYTRNLVFQNEMFEVVLICWDVNSKSNIHDHPSDGCWFVGLEGTILEQQYVKTSDDSLKLTNQYLLNEGDISYIHDYIGYHSVGNVSPERIAVSLHIYSPPIRKCSVFKENGLKWIKSCDYYSKNGKIF
jgi:cysteine dioxygenase